MGVLRGTARLLLEEHRRLPFSGSVLELGRMQVFLSAEELRHWARVHQVELVDAEDSVSHDPRLAAHGCMSDVAFFQSLGFNEVVSSDVSDRESPDVVFNLNDELPKELEGHFDAVFDGGTLHHVFDIRKALSNVHRALKIGGRFILGCGASSNHVDHGFYMFSPTLFHDYFEANRYSLEVARFYEFDRAYWAGGRLFTTPWRIYDYRPGCLDDLSYGGFGRGQMGLFFVATRSAQSTCNVVPMQSYFDRFLDGVATEEGASPGWTSSSLYRVAKRWGSPLRHRRSRARLPLVARY